MALLGYLGSSGSTRLAQPMDPTAAAPPRTLRRLISFTMFVSVSAVGPKPKANVVFCAKPSSPCSQDLLVGLRLRGGTRRLRERAHNGPAREVDLEGVVPKALGVAQNEICGLGERRLVGRLSPQLSFGLGIAPRLVCDAAKRKARILDGVAVKLEANRDRYQRKCIGEPIANLEIRVVRLEAPRRQLDRRNELVGLEVGVALRRIAGQAMEVCECNRALPAGPRHMHAGFQHGQRHAHV